VVAILFASVLVISPVLRVENNASIDWPSLPTLLGVLGAGITLGSLAWAIRTDRFVGYGHVVSSPLTAEDRRGVRRQFAGTEGVVQERVPVLLAIARQERRLTQALVPFCSGVILNALAGLLDSNTLLLVVSNMVVLGAGSGTAVYLVVNYRHVGKFLTAHETG
jgi:hypothetical protein